MFGLGAGEILIILVAALIFIGPKKLPALARTLGRGLSEFQNAARGITTAVQEPMEQDVAKTPEKKAKPESSETESESSEDQKLT